MAHPPSLAQFSTAPIFNTKAVARTTGVPPDTFRAWERRYRVPQPQRTQGGHRLYSERDIEIIRWLRDRTNEGMNISHAVMLLGTVLEEAKPTAVTSGERAMDVLAEELAAALTTFEVQQAEQIISEAFAIYPFDQVLLNVIQPMMVDVGERWHRGDINVAAEHFATEFIRRKLSSLLNVFENNPQRETIVIGCAPEELHDMGVLFASLFLVRRGYHVIYLGPQVPQDDLLATVEAVKPALVCLSASTLQTATNLATTATALLKKFPHVRFGYGGRIFNTNVELRQNTPGVFLGHDSGELIDTVVSLLSRGSTSTSPPRS